MNSHSLQSGFGISLRPYYNQEISDCFKEISFEEKKSNYSSEVGNNEINLLYNYYSNLITKYLVSNNSLHKIDKYNIEIIILYYIMKNNPKAKEYYLNIVKKQDIKKYKNYIKSLKKTKSPVKKRKTRVPVPDNLKDDKYWKKRKANTLSVRRSRKMKKTLLSL